MITSGIEQFAEALVFVHGKGAAAEAAQHAKLAEKTGNPEMAETWRVLQRSVEERRLAA